MGYGVHLPQLLTNAWMIGEFFRYHVAMMDLPPEQAQRLGIALNRLAASNGAVIMHAFDRATIDALYDTAGLSEILMHRLMTGEIASEVARHLAERKPKGYSWRASADEG